MTVIYNIEAIKMASLGNDVVMLDPSVIYFTFSRIRPVFSCGRTIDSTYEQFISGELSPTDLPLLCVFTDGEGRYYSQNNRRLFLYKKLQSEGKLSVVPVRLRPLPSTKRMGHKYSPSKCSLTAKLMGRAGGAPPSGSSAPPAVDAEPTSTKSKSRSSSSSSLHEHPRAAAAPPDSSVSKAEVTTSSSKPQMEKSATHNTRMKKQQKKKGYKNTVREDSDEDNVNSNLADVLASLNKKHWLQGSEEEEEEEKEEKLTFLTKKSSRQNKKKNKGRSEEQ